MGQQPKRYLDEQGNVIQEEQQTAPAQPSLLTRFLNGLGSWEFPGRQFDDNGVLLPKQYDAQGKPSMPEGGRALGDYLAAHPIREGANLALTALPLAAPFGPPAVQTAAKILAHPTAGGLIGGGLGYKTGGIRGGIEGAMLGYGGGLLGQKWAKSVLEPNPNAGGRLIPRATPTVNESLIQGLTEAQQPSATQTTLAASHPTGGGFTQPPSSPNLGAGGRLMPRSGPSPVQAAQDVLNSTLKQPSGVAVGYGHPNGGGFTVPPEMTPVPSHSTRPLVTYSPQAEAVLKGTPAARPPTEGVMVERLFQELSRKPILSPAEAAQLAQLKKVVGGRAADVGLGYASGGIKGLPK